MAGVPDLGAGAFGTALAVLLDATIIRAVLLPAVMALLGEKNWWLPRWLAWLAWGAGIGGLIGVIFFNEASRIAVAAVALLMAWELVTAIGALRSPRVAPPRAA